MAAAVSGSKTVTRDSSPFLTAAKLTTLMATAPENMTRANLRELVDAAAKLPGGEEPTATLGSIFV